MKWFKHAFAIESPDTVELNERQRKLVDAICAEIVRRRMATPALLLLEMHRPFNYVSAQLMHFFQPILSILTDTGGYEEFVRFLEQRGSVDHVIRRIDALETGASSKRQAPEEQPTQVESQIHSDADSEKHDEG